MGASAAAAAVSADEAAAAVESCMDPSPDLLRCDSVADLIAAWASRRRRDTPSFSVRAFARAVGEPNQTLAHSVAAGARRLTLVQAARWLPQMSLSPPEQEHLLALVRREEAEAELRRLRSRAGLAPTQDAAAQIALQEQTVARVCAALEVGRPPPSEPASPPDAAPRLLPWIDGEHADDADQALARAVERGGRLTHLEADRGVGAPPLPLYGLTEAVSPDQLLRLRAELRRAVDDLRSVQERGAVWTVQLSLFPLSRPLHAEAAQSPAPRAPEGPAPPAVVDWIAPSADGARGWLSAWMRWRLAAEPGFTYADFSRLCDQPDRAILWKILHRKQGLTAARAPAFARGIGLEEDEEELLVLLAERDRHPSPEARALVQRDIEQRAALQSASVLTLRRARQLSGWAPYAIHELANCAGFQADPCWMSAALDGRVTPAEVERALDMLFTAHMLESLPAGLRPVAERWQLDRPARATVPELAVLRYHQAMAEQERLALQRWLAGARDPELLTLAVQLPARAETVSSRLGALFERLQGLCVGSEPRTQVVQICLNGWGG